MKLPYPKPALTYSQQAQQLMARGMVISDLDFALQRLQHDNYYRLGAYWLPFEADHTSHRFKPGTRFEQVVQLYEADHTLRLVVLEAVSRIEVSVRAQWAYQFGHAHGAHPHLDQRLAHNPLRWQRNLDALRSEVERSDEVFIRHLLDKYVEDLPPIWAACEVMSFGLFSRWFDNTASDRVRKQVAAVYGLSVPLMVSWLRHLTHVRNICAHHGRLWNREFTITPATPTHRPAGVAADFQPGSRRVYNTLLILAYWTQLLPMDEPWIPHLGRALSHPALDLRAMGFPVNWQHTGVWAASTGSAPQGRQV